MVKMKVLITGSSGYIGSLLVNSWLNNPKIEKIVAIDSQEPKFLHSKKNPKIQFIKQDVADVDFDEIESGIDAVVHAAYVIRKPYFKSSAKLQKRSNFEGAENVFNFAFKHNIKKLIHFSTVAVYGANSENSLGRKFIESDPIRETRISYGVDKAAIERKLEEQLMQQDKPVIDLQAKLSEKIAPGK